MNRILISAIAVTLAIVTNGYCGSIEDEASKSNLAFEQTINGQRGPAVDVKVPAPVALKTNKGMEDLVVAGDLTLRNIVRGSYQGNENIIKSIFSEYQLDSSKAYILINQAENVYLGCNSTYNGEKFYSTWYERGEKTIIIPVEAGDTDFRVWTVCNLSENGLFFNMIMTEDMINRFEQSVVIMSTGKTILPVKSRISRGMKTSDFKL